MTNKSTLAQGLSHAWPWTKPIGSSPTTSRLLRFSLLCMLILLCGGSMWADDATLAVDFEEETTSYTDWTFTNFATKQTNSGVAAHGGSYFGSTGGKTSGSLVTKEKLAKPKNIQFYISKTSTNSTASSWIIKVSTDGEEWTDVKTQSASADITKGTWTEVTQDLTSYTNVYVGIFYDGTTAIRTIDDVTLTYENVNDTRTATTIALADGYATTGVEGKTVALPTATVMAGETAVTGAEVTWKSSDESVAKIEDNKISLLTPGTATITASYAGNGTYKSSKATYELTVTEVSVEGLASMAIIFKETGTSSDGSSKVSSIDDIISEGSDYVSAIPTATNVYNGRSKQGLKLGAKSNPGTLTLTLAQAVKPIKITFDAMQYSAGEASITVNGKTITNLGSELATYSIVYDGNTEVSEITISTPEKRAYITNVKIYYEGVVDNRTATTMAFAEGYTTSGTAGQAIDLPTATVMAGEASVEGATVTWTSSDESVATISGDVINLLAAGTATIKAEYAGDDTYKNSEKSYTVTVTEAPITTAGALNDAAKDGGNDGKPVTYNFTNAKVVYVNGSYNYIADATGYALLYGSLELTAGKLITGTLTGTAKTYNGLPEIAVTVTNINVTSTTDDTETATPTTITVDKLGDNINNYIKIESATYVSADGQNLTFKVGETSFIVRNQFKLDVSALEANKVYNITGFGSEYTTSDSRTLQVYLTEIAEATPTIQYVYLWASVSSSTATAEEVATVSQALFDRDSGFPANYDAVSNSKELFTLDETTGKYTLSYTNVNVPADGMGISWTVLVNKNSLASSTFKWVDIDKAGLYDITFTYDPTATENQLTATATKKDFYILGVAGWSLPADLKAMTWDGEKQAYTYSLNNTSTAYFCFADGGTDVSTDDWTTFNSTYRWALGEGDTEVGQESLNTPLQLQKTSGAIKLPAGTWTISINPSNMTMTITDKAAEEPVAGDVTATWDFRSNANPRAVGLFQGQNAQGKLDSNVQGIQLDIDATTGKFDSQARTSDAQVNNGTVIKVPVRHAGDEVTVLGNYQVNYTIGANEESVTELSKTYTATEADAQLGNVVITSTGTTYFYYIQVVQKEYIAPVTGFDNVEGSIKWTIGNETSGTVSDDIKEAIGSTSLTVGGDLTQTTNSTYAANNGVEMVVFNPKSNKLGTVESAMVEYRVKVKAGLKFKPTSVSYDAIKDGTDDATYSWSYTIDGEESQKTVVAKDDILRNNNTTGSPALTHVHNLTVDETSEFTFRIYVSGFNSGKKLALSNIIINGTVNGTIEEIPSYTLTAVASPEEGGSVKITPAGGEYEEGSTIKVTATPNFGYHFVKWQDATETTVSEDATYSFDIQKNEELTAVFTAVETYALTVNVEGGNSYQVTASPEATDGKYEAGTEVTLTAVENPVVKFTNWSTSATEKEIKVTINEDTEITANFAATDEIVAAWDFYEALGNSGKQDRAAAFKGENNDGTILTLRNAEGTSVAWLDRNYTNPYNGAICAINWQKKAYGEYYWQTKVNASSYKTMKVYSEMYYNYRAYNKYDVQYSVDGTEWTTLGTFELSKDDWSKLTLNIPEAADNKEEVYVRWIKAEDAVLDETASDNGGNFNDGIGIANIFITGTKELVDDGTAPVLQSQVPAANSENASINGQVVLTFDEKIQLTGGTKATLGEEELEPIVAGKALMFKYQGLDYDTEYTFTLPANFVSDLMNNTLEEKISFTFKTMTRPTVTKAAYDFIVPDDGTFAEAVAAANSRSDKTKRYFIFVKKGEYQLMGTGETENAEDDDHNPYTYTNRITDITASNISIIGEDRDATILYNSPDHEGIGVTATLRITKDVENTYIEDITIKNAWEYTGTTGRAVTIQDKGTRTIAKNVKLLSYQDTYYSNNQSGEFFFEDGEIHGTVDFVCGTGDVIYKDVTLYLEKRTGNVISAPNQPKEFGYVFLDCTIDGDAANEGTYYLGRPWGTGVKAQFVNTQMKVTPAAAGWTEMGAGRYPAVFAEFNSYKEDMSPIDLSGRKTSFGASNTTTAVESSGAELTTEQVASLTVQNIFGDWLPTQYTIQEEAPSNVKIDQNGKLTWDADDYALCYVVCADGDAIAVTTENSFDTATAGAPALRRSGDTVTYTVRAANAMGGLGEESAAASPATGINATLNDSTKDSVIYDLNGRRVMTPTKGVYIINGKKVVIK